MKIVRWLFVLLCTALFAQFPIFVDQYLMRLEGHLAESSHQIDAFTQAAFAGGKSLDQYITKFLAQSDPDFLAQGRVMQAAVGRHHFLTSACAALQSANPFVRPVVFVRYVDRTLLAETWDGFTPGLLITLNLALWAFIGFVCGWLLLSSFCGFWGVVRGR